ncbi:type II toxin-antitoxin system RelE/ParE family toxin [Wolbachia endosymbiont (group A) of Therophilus tumidulus]|uniref:type II toxin-antitoxin system RelE family toxin n=1 Tax=Wolbachia endosymbiont (group A) of Therophilus tumidulus TaxID=3066214 RepID=UPI00376F1895
MDQEKLNVTVSFEGELARYLKDIAEIDNRTVEEMLVHLVTEALEEDIEFSKMIEKQDADGEELIRTEDVMRYYLSEEGKQKYEIAYLKDVLEKDFPAIPPTVRSRIIKAIEEKLTTDPLKAGIPLRGKLKKD